MLTRREAIKNAAIGAGALGLGLATGNMATAKPFETTLNPAPMKYLHSVCKWCYNDIPMEEFCERIQDLSIKSVEIIGPKDWEIAKKYGLTCAMGNAPFISLTDGLNKPENKEKYIKGYLELIDTAADMGIPNLICFSGNRNGMDDEVGLENCAMALDGIMKKAEQKGVNIVMELLNSKVNHKDYQCDHTPWGVKLVEKVGSPNFKLLYDIYHMQIMEGDVIRTIKGDQGKGIESAAPYIAHYHTGGVPGRNEIDESQELYYPAIMQAIADTGFKGFVAQEFIPARTDKLASLNQGVQICDV